MKSENQKQKCNLYVFTNVSLDKIFPTSKNVSIQIKILYK